MKSNIFTQINIQSDDLLPLKFNPARKRWDVLIQGKDSIKVLDMHGTPNTEGYGLFQNRFKQRLR